MAKRRVLEKLIINEISGVDNPCQENARVAIMKRENNMTEQTEDQLLDGQLLDLEAKLMEFNKVLAAVGEAAEEADKAAIEQSFEQKVEEIRKRDNCSRTDALSKARKEAPEDFASYCGDGPTPMDFDILVASEIQKGCVPAVAAQRVGLKYPEAAAAMIAKASKHPFEAVVDTIMARDNCNLATAMKRARREQPVKFHHYQNGV
jgi:hypothetical protein